MREIPLNRGFVVKVDDCDFEWLSQWKWYALKGKHTWYAERTMTVDVGKEASIRMHRLILNAPSDKFVDHMNRDGLDNQRNNLRICSNIENMRNQHRRTDNTSGYKGVGWDGYRQMWRARIKINGARKNIGHFNTPEEAALAYDVAARQLFGEFARCNF